MTRDEAKLEYAYFYSGTHGFGVWVSTKETLSEYEFEQRYPPENKTLPQKENSDKTKAWLADRKSY